MSSTTTDKTIKAYSDPTWLYDIRGFFILTFAYQDTLWRQIRFFNNNIRNIHAEFAVGSGTLFAIILIWRRIKNTPQPKEIIVSDYVPSMLEAAQKRFQSYPFITCSITDIRSLPYHDAYFDSINIANSLHCISDIDIALQEVFRVLKPGGTFASNTLIYPTNTGILGKIATAINNWGMRKGILHTPYTTTSLRDKFLSIGFEIVSEEIHGNAYYALLKRP